MKKSVPACTLRCRFLISLFDIRRAQVQRRADEETGGLSDARAGMIHTGVEALFDEFDQARGHKVVVVHGFGIIADGGRVAHDDKHVADAKRVRSEQISLDAQQVASAGGEVQRGLDAHFALHHITHRPGGHAHARHRGVGNVDHVRARIGEERCARQQFVSREFRVAGPFPRRWQIHPMSIFAQTELVVPVRSRVISS